MKSVSNRNRRLERRANGLCYDCGDPVVSQKARCAACLTANLQRQRESTKKLTKNRIATKICIKCGKHRAAPKRKDCVLCLAKASIWGRSNRVKLVHTVLSHYSQGMPKCICCGEIIVAFLTIDHIYGGGCQERKATSGYGIYRRIIRENFPPNFRVMCMNCNFGRQRNGGVCPHQNI